MKITFKSPILKELFCFKIYRTQVIKDYFTTVGVGRNAKTFIDSRVATFLLSELSTEFKYYMINQFVMDGDNLVLDLDRVPINIVK